MSTGAIFWEPAGGGMQSIDVDGLSSWEELPTRQRVDAIAYSGRMYSTDLQGGLRVAIGLEVFAAGDLERQIHTLQSHIDAGGVFGVCSDKTKAWCGYLKTAPLQGATSLSTGGNVWHQAKTAAMIADDELTLESIGDTGYLREVTTAASGLGALGTAVTLNDAVRYEHSSTAWLRHRYYLPQVTRPADTLGRPLITSRQRRIFTLAMTVRLDHAGIGDLYALKEPPFYLNGISSGLTQAAAGVPKLRSAAFKARDKTLR